MIFEHEIPSGSKLYFGDSAKIKREIEFVCAKMLENLGFEEIVTPMFSYHQHESFDEQKTLVRLNDAQNHEVTLRADSTVDVVRIVTKRLGRTTESKKWFYIQPTMRFSTLEQYQVGAEILGGNFEEVAKTAKMLLDEIGLHPSMQIANIRIPHLLNEKYGISLEVLKSMNIEQVLMSDLPWIEQLVHISCVDDMEDLSPYPPEIKVELQKIKEVIVKIGHHNAIVSPLFYAKMRYYDSLTFRMFEGNNLLAKGGIYTVEGVEAAGFALNTDECICNKMNKVSDE